jgi:hypothetical protein
MKSTSEKNEMGPYTKDVRNLYLSEEFSVQCANVVLAEKNKTLQKLGIEVRVIAWGWRRRGSCAHQIHN